MTTPSKADTAERRGLEEPLYCENCLHLETDHKWYAQSEEWNGEEHWECRFDICDCEVDWSDHHFSTLKHIITTTLTQQRDELLVKVKGLVKYSLDEVQKRNEHLDSRMQQDMYMRSKGYIEAITDVQATIKGSTHD